MPMTEKYFFDTNIFIYSYSTTETDKSKICTDFLHEKLRNNLAVISTQVLKEFASIMISKFGKTPAEVINMILNLRSYEQVNVVANDIIEALELMSTHKFSFWDSLIITSAIKANCNYLVTEDMQHDQIIHDIKIINPFLS